VREPHQLVAPPVGGAQIRALQQLPKATAGYPAAAFFVPSARPQNP
jgi:hypothetical protein